MKDKLQYNTNIERADFVVKYQGQNIADDLPNKIIYCLDDNEYLENCEVKVNENYKKEQLKKAKEAKQEENLKKAKEYEQTGTVEYKNCLFEMSDSNRKNLSDTQEALTLQGLTSTQWNSKDDTLVELTIEDIQFVRLNLILQTIQKIWIEDYPNYKSLIDKATTLEELNNIIINY